MGGAEEKRGRVADMSEAQQEPVMAEAVAVVPANDECCICLDRFSPHVSTSELPCGHRFHAACLSGWFSQNGNCPLCRYEAQPVPEAPRLPLCRTCGQPFQRSAAANPS